MRLATDVFNFTATGDVSALVGQTIAGMTDAFVYRILSFDGKQGVIMQRRRRDDDPQVEISIRALPIVLLDYVTINGANRQALCL